MISWNNWGRSISRSRGICRDRNNRGRGICWDWGRGIGRSWGMISILVVFEKRLVWAWNSLILDISMVLLVLINKVVHNLHSAVWQLYPVLTYKNMSISMIYLYDKRWEKDMVKK